MVELIPSLVSLVGRLLSRKRVTQIGPVYNNCTVMVLNNRPIVPDSRPNSQDNSNGRQDNDDVETQE